MKTFDYIIVTSDNKWESTGKKATDKELVDDLLEVGVRLREEGRTDETITVVKGENLEFDEYTIS
ncbi:MAG: hypothetical protein OQK82_03690 [Candidatus Pacearchaeota archaeon]|nr:hypothetical protein [Candidatus Pacearchaeota archaeon]